LNSSGSHQDQDSIPVSEKYPREENGQASEIVLENKTISISDLEKGAGAA